MFASELVITAASSAITLPPTPTQDSLLDVGVADVALSAFVATSAVFPPSVGSRQCQDLWSFVHRWLQSWSWFYLSTDARQRSTAEV